MLASDYSCPAAGDYLILCAKVVEQPQDPFAAMGSHCQEHSCSTAIFCYNSKWILSCELDSFNSKDYHYKTI